LSTDLVASTALNQRLGDVAATAIERELLALAHEQVAKQRGVLVKDTGDGLMVAFQSARPSSSIASTAAPPSSHVRNGIPGLLLFPFSVPRTKVALFLRGNCN
jgi:class 3 adenylate cyclase